MDAMKKMPVEPLWGKLCYKLFRRRGPSAISHLHLHAHLHAHLHLQ